MLSIACIRIARIITSISITTTIISIRAIISIATIIAIITTAATIIITRAAGRTTTTHADILKEPLPQIVEGGLVVYLYMSREVLQRLGPRLACAYGGREQTLVLTRDFEIPGWSEPRRLQRGRTTLLAYAAGNAPACLMGRHMGDTWGNTRLT